MIQKLQALKARKGFTIIELIVVIAIIAVLMAVIFPMINSRRSRIAEGNSAARDFYAAMQSTMIKYSLYEGPLSPVYEATATTGDMYYYKSMNGNYPFKRGTTPGDFPVTTSLYVEIATKNNVIGDVVVTAAVDTETDYGNGIGLYNLRKEAATDVNNEFGRLLRSELQKRINYQDGFYYAKVTYKNILTGTLPQKMEAETIKVDYTLFSRDRMPSSKTGNFTNFRNNALYFGDDYVIANGDVFGVCAANAMLGLAGTTLS